jgi:integrase
MAQLITKPAASKPSKPRPDFPLFPHAAGVWAKKIRGKLHYFGPWSDPDGALNKWLDQKDALLAGRTPRAPRDGLTVATLCNHYLTHKQNRVESGELAGRTFATYYLACERIVKAFGRDRLVEDLAAEDFRHLRTQISKTWGPVALANEIQRVRSVFKFGFDEGLIDKPIRYGQAFDKPNKLVMRRNRAERGKRMFERDELAQALTCASVNMKAMILLGINAALGNTDLALLPIKAINLKTGWLDYLRAKTAIALRIPLWPETIEAIKAAIANRHEEADPADKELLFIGPRGENYIGGHRGYRVAGEMARTLAKAKIGRRGLSFYALRHTFETIGGESRDQVAVNAIMGHAPSSSDMSAVYRERIDDTRLQAVVNHVRGWLFPASQVVTAAGSK